MIHTRCPLVLNARRRISQGAQAHTPTSEFEQGGAGVGGWANEGGGGIDELSSFEMSRFYGYDDARS